MGDALVASRARVGLLARLLGDDGFPDELALVAAVRARLGS